VVQIIRSIGDEIKNAHKEGQHFLITSIPTIFDDIPNMNNADRQRAVWSSVIELLTTKNYKVSFNASSRECKIKITWLSADEEHDMKFQTQILTNHHDPKL
jgi:hypothetical protein